MIALLRFVSLFPVASAFCVQAWAGPALAAIREADLKRDVYALADPHFNGRSAGTIDELKAAAWLAEQYRAIGLAPAGDDGTYFQYFTLWRNQLSERATVSLDGAPLEMWRDVAVAQLAHATIDAPVVYLGPAAAVDLAAAEVAGRVVALEANPAEFNPAMSLPTWRYARSNYTKYGLPLLRRGAAAIIFVNEEVGEKCWDDSVENFKRGTYALEGDPNAAVTATVPVLWVRAAAKARLQGGKAVLKAALGVDRYPYPSVNIVGKVAGTDPKLAAEHVLYSGHTDAHGIRNPIKGDRIYHGADDNCSADAALLACARAFVRQPGKRSVLFVIHGAEERGLFGSRYYAANPTVPLASIVAVLNGEMIGRNDPKTATLLGATAPHKNSDALAAMALAANAEGPRFTVETAWDSPTHPESWYFRSDHLPYARLNIPAVMFTTLLHPDYHTPQDNAQNIDYAKLTRMTEWMYRTGWKVADAPERPAVNPDFKLER
jgi:hypothetical protein